MMTQRLNAKVEETATTMVAFDLPCVVQYYDDGWRTGIFFRRGRDFVSLIAMDGMAGQTVHIRRWMKSREKEFRPALHGKFVYPVQRAAQHFINASNGLGMTKSAEEVLKAILAGKSAPAENRQTEEQTQGDDMGNVTIEVDKKEYKEVKAASGRKSLDSGDSAAKLLRGKDLDEAYEIAAKHLGETKLSLKRKYGKLNAGMQRMNLGNRIRKVLNAKG